MIRRSGFGWLEFIVGVLLIILGLYTFTRPIEAVMTLVIVYGILALLMGIGDIVMYIRASRFTGFAPMLSLVSGIPRCRRSRHRSTFPFMVHNALHSTSCKAGMDEIHHPQRHILLSHGTEHNRHSHRIPASDLPLSCSDLHCISGGCISCTSRC